MNAHDASAHAVIRKLTLLLNSESRWKAALVFLLIQTMALMEMAGVASVMPFAAILMNPKVAETQPTLNAVYHWMGFANERDFLFWAGILMLVLFVVCLALKALTTYAITRFSSMQLHTLACRVFVAYLRQPYEFFLTRNTAMLTKAIVSEVGEVTNGVMVPLMRLVAAILVSIALIGLLILVQPWLSLAVAVALAACYGLLHLITRAHVSVLGEKRLKANRDRFIVSNELLGGIKELRLLGRETAYLDRFREQSLKFAGYQASAGVIRELPRYGIEAIALGGMLATLLYLERRYGGVQDAFPLIALYGFAVYRLLPNFQQIFASLSHLRFSLPALTHLYEDVIRNERSASPIAAIAPLQLKSEIKLDRVGYCYPDRDRRSLENLSVTIKRGQSVAFIGETGAGKTTVLDVLLGLLTPTEGEVIIDGERLSVTNIRAWQRAIGYVPQSIFLADDTIAANIAFGLRYNGIDHAFVERAARIAQIHDFVVNELPNGYDTVVGERGIRLSGGQRQRIGIARALYHNPQVIVFDEATSALDNATEKAVLESVEQLHGSKTIIMIAHRLSTVRNCDCIHILEQGRVLDSGTFVELSERHSVRMLPTLKAEQRA
jgi:ABC-type bacteriocin/lantibiotic exporter with double-glycine peptidase domain